MDAGWTLVGRWSLLYIVFSINRIISFEFYQFFLCQFVYQLTTDLIDQNVDLRTIMEIMGHSESTMTLFYARSNQKKKKEAINNRIINGIEKWNEEEVKTA